MINNWKCGKCGKEYEFERLLKILKMIPIKEGQEKKLGKTAVCSCGYVFGKDKFILKTKVKVKLFKVEVSTVFLELNHWGMYYETMVFGDKIECNFQDRYATRKEAIKGHKKVVKKLKKGEFTIIVDEAKLELK